MWTARTALEQAEWGLRSGRPGRDEIEALLDECVSVAQAHGQTHLVERADARRARLARG